MPQGLSLNLDTNDVEEIIEDYLYNISKGYETEDSEESAIDLYDLYEDQLSEYGEDDEDGVTPTEDNTILHRMVPLSSSLSALPHVI
ncbi:hypothetical protein AMATHDRAFT_65674 [Amanita thiersii Skay4041]|uniref:Uncharacterized protein n=1 Tax=Amanita thiersii Skay4041 TaxID=703135 RepID=A0A2A9NGE9_9AGAR|nr:hypothetical protein AMATHDRAFT_65674 [Amanita thiersii Skay4041]